MQPGFRESSAYLRVDTASLNFGLSRSPLQPLQLGLRLAIIRPWQPRAARGKLAG